MKKKISIITVTKNSEKYLEKNILSVHKQKYKNYEHIIIDGKSTDKTIDIINKHKKKIKYFISEKDKGLYDAMNKGIKKSNGDIIGILNSDDIYYKKTLEIVNKYFNKYKKLDFLFGSVHKHKLLHGYYPKKLNGHLDFIQHIQLVFLLKKKLTKK